MCVSFAVSVLGWQQRVTANIAQTATPPAAVGLALIKMDGRLGSNANLSSCNWFCFSCLPYTIPTFIILIFKHVTLQNKQYVYLSPEHVYSFFGIFMQVWQVLHRTASYWGAWSTICFPVLANHMPAGSPPNRAWRHSPLLPCLSFSDCHSEVRCHES